MLSLAALYSATASALLASPELGRCVKVAPGTGEYELASCTGGSKPGGTYDWLAGATKTNFASASGAATLETKGGSQIACKSILEEGNYITPKVEHLTARLFGCQITTLGGACQNAGPEEVVTPLLEGKLGFITNKLTKEGKLVVSVGVDLRRLPEPPSPVIVEFNCDTPAGGLVHVVLLESVIAKVTAIDKMASTFKKTYKASKGKQSPTKFEGQPKDTLLLQLSPNPPEEGGLTAALTTSNAEPLEIKAKE